jgi:hypothetical protein
MNMDFPGKPKPVGSQPANGSAFLANAKSEHAALFVTYIAKADEFVSVDEYTDALQAAAWKLTERLAKSSWKNGMARGETGRRG